MGERLSKPLSRHFFFFLIFFFPFPSPKQPFRADATSPTPGPPQPRRAAPHLGRPRPRPVPAAATKATAGAPLRRAVVPRRGASAGSGSFAGPPRMGGPPRTCPSPRRRRRSSASLSSSFSSSCWRRRGEGPSRWGGWVPRRCRRPPRKLRGRAERLWPPWRLPLHGGSPPPLPGSVIPPVPASALGAAAAAVGAARRCGCPRSGRRPRLENKLEVKPVTFWVPAPILAAGRAAAGLVPRAAPAPCAPTEGSRGGEFGSEGRQEAETAAAGMLPSR